MLEVFIQANAWAALAEDTSERRLANLDWFTPHVGADVSFKALAAISKNFIWLECHRRPG
jgi:hypothetical protein